MLFSGGTVRTKIGQVLDMVEEGINWKRCVWDLYNTCWWSTRSQWFDYTCGEDAVSYYEEIDYDDGRFCRRINFFI